MIKKLLLLLTLLFVFNASFSQTTLNVGDLAIIGMDTNGSNTQPKDFIFVPFVDLDAGTIIYFTDKPANGSFTFTNPFEGTLQYTVPTGGIVAGTVVRRFDNLSDFVAVGSGLFSLTNLGDNITAYQGPSVDNVDRYLHAVGEDAGKTGTFPAGFTAILLLGADDGKYTGTRNGQTASTYFSLINDINNWFTAFNGVSPFDLTSFAITITPGVTVSPSNLFNFFYFENNGPSIEQTFLVEGENLIDDILITLPTGQNFYEISLTEGTGFSDSITLSPIDGTVDPTTIYVRLMSGLVEGGYVSTITVSSTNTATKNVNLSGDVVARPPLTLQTIWSGPLDPQPGLPNGIEVYVLEDILDLSFYALTNGVNNFFFPSGTSASAGDFIVITDDAIKFQEFFGFAPDYVDPVGSLTGKEGIALFEGGDVIDTYGFVGANGAGTYWDYDDGWASRVQGTGPDGENFNRSNWTISTPGVLTGAPINSEADRPVPLGKFLITWLGKIDRNWNNTGNWSPGRVPNGTEDVNINVTANPPLINGDFAVNRIFLYDDVTIQSGSLTANNNVNGTLGGHFEVASGASLLTFGSISGDEHVITRNTTFSTGTGKYSVVGTPVSGANTSLLGKLVYAYDETIPYDPNNGDDRFFKVTNVPMPAGEGFFSAFTGTVEFIGNPNTGTFVLPLVYNPLQDGINAGFNLISNPYPSAIDVVSMFFANNNFQAIDATVYIWDDDNPPGTRGTNEDYITYNEVGQVGANGKTFNGYIGTAQGFIVKAKSNNPLTLSNALRVTGFNSDQNFFRTRQSANVARTENNNFQKVKLKIENSSTGDSNEILLARIEEATYSVDSRFDSYKIGGNKTLNLYSVIEGAPYAIQAVPVENDDQVLPLGMTIGQAGNFTFKIKELSNFPESTLIYIYDKMANSYSEISPSRPVNFTSDAMTDSDRFSVVFSSNITLSNSDDILNDKNISLRATNSKLLVRVNNGLFLESAKITVSDILGRVVLTKSIIESFNNIEINHTFESDTVYIVELKSELGTIVKKIIIK